MENKEAKKLVSQFLKLKCIPVGAYGRSSHDSTYNDLDFLTFRSLTELYDDIYKLYDHIEVFRNGNKYMQVVLNEKYTIDIWHTTKEDFYRDYLMRTLTKEKVIYINKFLKNA